VQEWRRSNLKQQAYCLKAGINYSSFVYWKGVLTAKESQNIEKSFIPVKIKPSIAPSTNTSSAIHIKLASGHVVCIPLTMDLEEIARFIHLLEDSHA
jgi:hypothetical protein